MRSFVSAFVPAFDVRSIEGRKIASSASSRSTSASSSSSPHTPELPVAVASIPPAGRQTAAESIPEYEYPVPFIVKNTFIDTQTWRPSSFNDFYQERQIHSCVSRIGAPPGLEPAKRPTSLAAAIAEVTGPPAALALPTFSSFCSNDDGQQFFDALDTLPVLVDRASQQAQLPVMASPPPPPAQPPILIPDLQPFTIPPPQVAPVLRLAEALPQPELGSIDLPTVGSMGHHIGFCKPCAFFHTKGCAQGPQCEFCHLCDAGERKRRRKEKIALVREAQARNDQSSAFP